VLVFVKSEADRLSPMNSDHPSFILFDWTVSLENDSEGFAGELLGLQLLSPKVTKSVELTHG